MEMGKGQGFWRSRPLGVWRRRQIPSEANAKGNGTWTAWIGVGDEAGSVDPMDFGGGHRQPREVCTKEGEGEGSRSGDWSSGFIR